MIKINDKDFIYNEIITTDFSMDELGVNIGNKVWECSNNDKVRNFHNHMIKVTNIVSKVLNQIKCIAKVEFSILDHDTLNGKSKKSIGICWHDENGFKITIDDYFVEECYKYFVMNNICSTWELEGITLEEVICHEIAHIQEWRHGKKHTELTNRLIDKVELPEKYQYIRKNLINE